MFEIKNKVALITGGADGIGLALVKELLKNEAKGVTIADINVARGEEVTKKLKQEYGSHKVEFVETDTVNTNSFENAFKVTIQKFQQINILCNNAGILDEINWEKTIDVNLKGCINGTLLAYEKYFKNHGQGEEAVILNTCSVAGVMPFPIMPIYSTAKFGITGLTLSYGDPLLYDKFKIKVIAMAPGITNTKLAISDYTKVVKDYTLWTQQHLNDETQLVCQSPEFVAEESIKLIQKAPTGTIWVIGANKPAYQYVLNDKKNCECNKLN